MSSLTSPRGPLPARVYWTRRLLLVVVALALVLGVARLLGGSGGGGTGPSAQPVGADASSTPAAPTTTPSSPTTSTPGDAPTLTAGPGDEPGGKNAKKGAASASSTPLPASEGRCADDDVVVTPAIRDQAYAGRSVVFGMQLTTRTATACDFEVSSRTLVVKVTSGPDRIWSTQQCPGAVPRQSVVVRKDTPATVNVPWNGQRSDDECSRSTAWAEPGYYHAVAAAYGSAPVDEQFRLLSPPRPTVTAHPEPRKKKQQEEPATRERASASPSTSRGTTPDASPSRR